MGVGIIGLVGKIHKWDESAMFFDGSSLGESTCSVVVLVLLLPVRCHCYRRLLSMKRVVCSVAYQRFVQDGIQRYLQRLLQFYIEFDHPIITYPPCM